MRGAGGHHLLSRGAVGCLKLLRGEHARRAEFRSGVDHGCGLRGGPLLQDLGAQAGEEKSAQVRIGTELAGLAQLYQVLVDVPAQLAKLAGKLIGAGRVLGLGFPVEHLHAKFAQGVSQQIERARQFPRHLVGIDARRSLVRRQNVAQDLPYLIVRKVADVLREMRDAIEFGEDHVDGQGCAQQAADLPQLRGDDAGGGNRRRGGVGHQKLLHAHTNHGGPSRRTEQSGTVSLGAGTRNHPLQRTRGLSYRLSGFEDGCLPGEPEIQNGGG